MVFPPNLYVIEDRDGKMSIYIKEEEVPAPIDGFIPIATYQLTRTEEAKRQITLTKRAPQALGELRQP